MFNYCFSGLVIHSVLALLVLVNLAACGGGGSSRKIVFFSPVTSSSAAAVTSSVTSLSSAEATTSNSSTSNSSATNSSAQNSSLTGSFLMGGAIQGTPLNIATVVTTLAGGGGLGDGRAEGVIRIGDSLYVAGSHSISKIVVATGETTTFAGSVGVRGSIDGLGGAARFDRPMGMATDGLNLFVTDSNNHAIRKISLINGAVSTLAGTLGTSGSADGTGAIARFFRPRSVTFDGTHLYVADTNNHTIRKITAGGVVTTLAGTLGVIGSANGTGAVASFNFPQSITTDKTNTQLYVADTNNHLIRRIVIADGAVTTLAGGISGTKDGIGAAASFTFPQGLTTNLDDLYVADTNNQTIRKIVIATGAVTTVAGAPLLRGLTDGTGADARFGFPQALTADGTDLYVADTDNNILRKMVIATSVVTTFAGTATGDGTGAAARFASPNSITTDGTDLYVADTNSQTIRKVVVATGAVTTFAGRASDGGDNNGIGTSARFNFPGGITSDGTNLYVADTKNHIIRKIVITSSAVSTFAGVAGTSGFTDGTAVEARFNNPDGITTDGTNLYVADTNNHTIRKIVIATREVTTFAGTRLTSGSADGTGALARFNTPSDITTDGTHLYVSDTNNNTLRKIIIATAEVSKLAGNNAAAGSSDGTGVDARFSKPNGITTDGTHLYVSDTDNNTLRKIVLATGEVITLVGTPGANGNADGVGAAARFKSPTGITTDGFSLFVTDSANNSIRKIE